MNVDIAYSEFRARVEQLLPEGAHFLPAASDQELADLAATLGRPVPEELVALLRSAGGQSDSADGPLEWCRFLTPAEIGEQYAMLRELFNDPPEEEVQPSTYRWQIWGPGWIPFAASDGNSFILDTEPGLNGVVGQIFFRPNVPDLDDPLASSLSEFFVVVNAELEAGSYTVDDGTLLLDAWQ
ncbi:MAG: SMI1/KNR4 family protein [Propionibacteriaceae bacterium]|nr:SMI1/KNR4 family protein [Propionibacteriaceae bacterium]